MSPAETIDKLCEMLSIAQTIIGQQAEMLMMHGIETYDGNLEELRGMIIAGGSDDYSGRANQKVPTGA